MIVERALRWAIRLAIVWTAACVSTDMAGLQALGASAARPRDPAAGILRGAEPVRIERGRGRACLLVHGWLSSPADFGRLPDALHRAGWDVFAPLLPGHGTSPEALIDVTAGDLLAAARRRHAELRGRYRTVALMGSSMGGAVAAVLAAERAPDALVLIAPLLEVEHKWYYVLPVRWWSAALAPFVRWVARPPELIRLNRPEVRELVVAYEAFPVEALRMLWQVRRAAVERVDPAALSVPTLLVYSEGDEVCSARAADAFYRRLPEPTRRRRRFQRSNHLVLLDYDREEAVAAIVGFLGEAAPGRP